MLKALLEIAEWLSPEPCPRCGAGAGSGFCDECRGDFLRIAAPCRHCGMPGPCATCQGTRADWHIDAVRAPFVYTAPLSRYLRGLKFGGQRLLGRALGELLAAELDQARTPIDALAVVPLHPRRLRTRQFNQSDELAVALARRLRLARLTWGIDRVVDTPPQTDLDRHARRRLATGVFRVRRDLSGQRIAIVDDVITTGATVNAVALALRAAGAARVEAWAVARTARTGEAT